MLILTRPDAYFSAVDAVLAGELDHSKALASSRDAGNAAAALGDGQLLPAALRSWPRWFRTSS